MPRILQRTRPGFCRRAIDKAKKWGAHLLLSTSLAAGSVGTSSCTEPVPREQGQTIADTGIWTEPYNEEVLQDEEGNLYLGKRFILRTRDSVSQAEVENLIREFSGRLTAYIPQINTYEIEVSGNVDEAIGRVTGNAAVEFVGRNYYFESAWDNDRYIRSGRDPLELGTYINWEDLEKGLWWSTQIHLSAGLDLIENSGVELNPVTIAVIDGGFMPYEENNDIPLVDLRYHFDFGDNDTNIFSGFSHGSQVASFAAAMNNGNRTNGVACTEEGGTFSVLPLKTLSDEAYTYILQQFGVAVIGDDLRMSAAMVYAAENAESLNIDVINISMGIERMFARDGLSFYPALIYTHERGIVTVVAAGNDDMPRGWIYPADVIGVIPVYGTALGGARNEIRYRNDHGASNFPLLEDAMGSICAPAQDLIIFYEDGSPHLGSGTSFAAPQVAGLAALIRSIDPDRSYLDVLRLMQENANEIHLDNDPNPLVRGQVWRRINVFNTVQTLIEENPVIDDGTSTCFILEDAEVPDRDGTDIDQNNLVYDHDRTTYHVDLSDGRITQVSELNVSCNRRDAPRISGETIILDCDCQQLCAYDINGGSGCIPKLEFYKIFI